MPIYEYKCSECTHAFEMLQKMDEQPCKKCPKCMQQSLVKLVSNTSFKLKGTGWYITDFKEKNKSSQKTEKQNQKERNKTTKTNVVSNTTNNPKTTG